MIRPIARLMARYSQLNWALIDQAIISVANLVTGILLARYLGLEEFGRFTLAWMAILFVNSIQHAVIVAPMMSIGVVQPDADRPAYFGAVMFQQLVFASLAFLLILIGVQMSVVFFPEWRTAGLALPLAATALGFQLQDFLRRYFFVLGRGRVATANDALRYLGQLIVLFWAFRMVDMDTAGALWIIAVAAFAAVLCAAFFVKRPVWERAILSATTARHWNFSKWMAGSALLQWTGNNLFLLTAGPILGASAVGALKAAQSLVAVTNIFFLGLENVVPVRAASLYHRDGIRGLLGYLKSIVWIGESFTAAVILVLAVAPEFWLQLVYGEEFAGYGALVRWFAAIHLVMFLGIPLSAGLRALEHTRALFIARALATAAAVPAVYPLLTRFGIAGAAAGMLLAQVVIQSAQITQLRQKVRRVLDP